MTPEPRIWIFVGVGARFPSGAFSSLDGARAWIAKYSLTGTLTAYPLDEGVFDWALRTGVVSERVRSRGYEPEFVAAFSSASQEHFHFENGAAG
jgi:hypothetical protein